MSRRIPGMKRRSRIIAATAGACMPALLAGCVMLETYGDRAVGESGRAVVEGYWRYQFLYDEELHVVSVDGKREGGKGGWPYAFSVSLPAGTHWLQLAILRNSRDIARCAMEWTFEARHRYKLQRLRHDQFLLAHPTSSPFPASISMVVTAPSGGASQVDVPATCGKEAMCREDSHCAPQSACQTSAGLAFGICTPR